MDPSLRPATVNDLPALAQVEAEAFGSDPYPPFFFRQALDLWPGLLLVADGDDGVAAGYVLAAVGTAARDAWVLSLGVRPSYGGRGLGRALMEAVHGALAAQAVGNVRLTVHPGNERAVRLYRHLGYQTEREDAAYYGPGEPRLIMQRELTTAGAKGA